RLGPRDRRRDPGRPANAGGAEAGPMTRAARLVAFAAVALLARTARSEPTSAYGPMPPAIESLVGAASEEAMAERAVAAVTGTDAEAAQQAARDLVAAGPAGMRRAAERLVQGDL